MKTITIKNPVVTYDTLFETKIENGKPALCVTVTTPYEPNKQIEIGVSK